MDMYEEIVAIRKRGEKAALATLVRRVGSTPRKDPAKMLIRQDGSFIGTVGGGCTEAEVWQAAQDVMAKGKPKMLRFTLNQQDAARDGLVCGGTVEFFIEPILPDPQLVIFGAGHISHFISKVAKLAGFKVTVVDDRARYASRERFPEADEVLVCEFDRIREQVRLHSNSYVIIVTRGHGHDQVVLEQVIDSPARFLGMVGSRRKSKIIFDYLRSRGISEELIARVESPVGVEIGSETPEEIAVSIVAHMIAVRKGVTIATKEKLHTGAEKVISAEKEAV
ncbi:MAG: XdhC family protein [Acidobacteria bacterium]|nr:XdhC family protein [Acidobacteriota bacterium]